MTRFKSSLLCLLIAIIVQTHCDNDFNNRVDEASEYNDLATLAEEQLAKIDPFVEEFQNKLKQIVQEYLDEIDQKSDDLKERFDTISDDCIQMTMMEAIDTIEYYRDSLVSMQDEDHSDQFLNDADNIIWQMKDDAEIFRAAAKHCEDDCSNNNYMGMGRDSLKDSHEKIANSFTATYNNILTSVQEIYEATIFLIEDLNQMLTECISS